MTDQELYEVVKAADTSRPSAVVELRHRHWDRIADYARLFVVDEADVRRAADEAFDACLHGHATTRSRTVLDRPLRLLLLTHVRTEHTEVRRDGAAKATPAAVGTTLPKHTASSALARGFAALSPRTQALLWHSVVEDEPDDGVALLTGDRPENVPDLVRRALASCHDATLHIHLDSRPTPGCAAFGRMLDAASRRQDVRGHPDLAGHLDACPDCMATLDGLGTLRRDPRPALAHALLGPLGPAYLAKVSAPGADTENTVPMPVRVPSGRTLPASHHGNGIPRMRWQGALGLLGAVSALATAVALLTTAPAPRDPTSRADSRAPTPGTRTAATAPTSAATASNRPPPAPPSASPTVSRPAEQPGRRTSPSPSDGHEAPSPTKSDVPFRATSFVPAVSAATGLCLDVQDGVFANGVDIVTTTCRDGARTQQWRFDESGLLRNRAHTDYCMDSRGSGHLGVGIWSCRALGRESGDNLVFTHDAMGRIEPVGRPGFALTAGSGSDPGTPVTLEPADSSAQQRWKEPTGP
ncbi:RICIN domain-containing protein [Streptomyces sp. SP18CS02]|uniref:RICIN domain-containing protein n=1 Tax=Streptomyces sp. SP18CS02 TaxID=3002531 RepID=UPI002E79C53B|nr:RICIN domain-containing protein [Streptomyces sp. SP18CS02]MEE1754468.1 RICIN domain-containing protein [Streptomyces sp. SP18CS02]